ncbi:TRAP transporter substrate-binding protein DctP [Notoacmeibacter marinus]|uniref:TRAP transporter substrate-binding protein DctP n=1 Tax=Notoacmeibacter marinus TaxID=1876515 RepID=UPI000DF14F7E|nr:TRAP transporter substrate-binding protein DctP [Notoacmeibacter marinus]
MKHYLFAAALAAIQAFVAPAMAADYTLSASLDTGPTHIRNASMRLYAKELLRRSDGKLELEIFDSASRYRGPDVATALVQGAIDIGVPADQHLGKFVANAGLLLMPMVYGLPRETLYKMTDGAIGDEVRAELESKLGVTILGRSLDLGHGTIFSADSLIVTPGDLVGRKVRVPGGAATLERYRVFEANPVQIAWSDLPQALERKTVATIWATHESVRSAKLWDAGIKYAFDDRQAYVQYVPMVSASAWGKLPEDMQALMKDTWEDMVDGFRDTAAQRQFDSIEINRQNGITVLLPDADTMSEMRKNLLSAQPGIVEELKMDPDLVARAEAVLTAE